MRSDFYGFLLTLWTKSSYFSRAHTWKLNQLRGNFSNFLDTSRRNCFIKRDYNPYFYLANICNDNNDYFTMTSRLIFFFQRFPTSLHRQRKTSQFVFSLNLHVICWFNFLFSTWMRKNEWKKFTKVNNNQRNIITEELIVGKDEHIQHIFVNNRRQSENSFRKCNGKKY
jgi:hypothetical protein